MLARRLSESIPAALPVQGTCRNCCEPTSWLSTPAVSSKPTGNGSRAESAARDQQTRMQTLHPAHVVQPPHFSRSGESKAPGGAACPGDAGFITCAQHPASSSLQTKRAIFEGWQLLPLAIGTTCCDATSIGMSCMLQREGCAGQPLLAAAYLAPAASLLGKAHCSSGHQPHVLGQRCLWTCAPCCRKTLVTWYVSAAPGRGRAPAITETTCG